MSKYVNKNEVDELIETAVKFIQRYPGTIDINQVLEEVVKDIRELPTVEIPESKTGGNIGKEGKWLINCDGYYPYCSLCGEEPERNNEHQLPTYCPSCGAKNILE